VHFHVSLFADVFYFSVFVLPNFISFVAILHIRYACPPSVLFLVIKDYRPSIKMLSPVTLDIKLSFVYYYVLNLLAIRWHLQSKSNRLILNFDLCFRMFVASSYHTVSTLQMYLN